MVKISGIIGLSILKKNNNYYFIFYDDHSNNKYCSDKIIFISEIFGNLENNDISFFIEDYKEDNKKYYIWNNYENHHLDKFNKVLENNKNNNNWHFTDIRLYLGSSIGEKLKNLNYIFNIKSDNNIKNNKIIYIQSKLKNKIYINYYNNLKNKLLKINKNLLNNKENSKLYNYYFKGYLINKTIFKDKFYEIELFIDSLMEFYSMIIINEQHSNVNLLNYGLFHSINFAYYLKKSNCEIIYETGITDNIFTAKFNLDKLSNTTACLNIDVEEIKNKIN